MSSHSDEYVASLEAKVRDLTLEVHLLQSIVRNVHCSLRSIVTNTRRHIHLLERQRNILFIILFVVFLARII